MLHCVKTCHRINSPKAPSNYLDKRLEVNFRKVRCRFPTKLSYYLNSFVPSVCSSFYISWEFDEMAASVSSPK